jgi:hypothetical protein
VADFALAVAADHYWVAAGMAFAAAAAALYSIAIGVFESYPV